MIQRHWTIGELLNVSSLYLKDKGIESPRLTAELFLAHLLKVDRIALYLSFDQPLSEDELAQYRALIRRRLMAEPVAYIRGVKEFWSLDFEVGPGVLIPRPETELLVELALKEMKANPAQSGAPQILDLGTGSGAIAVALAKSAPDAVVWATDISGEALDFARRNARRHGVDQRVHFLQGDLWEPVRRIERTFDFIVANPPYISAGEYEGLPPGVKDFEPRVALDGGEKGMTLIMEIIRGAPDFLVSGGWLLIEMDPGQTEAAAALMEENGYANIDCVQDYGRHFRVVKGRRR